MTTKLTKLGKSNAVLTEKLKGVWILKNINVTGKHCGIVVLDLHNMESGDELTLSIPTEYNTFVKTSEYWTLRNSKKMYSLTVKFVGRYVEITPLEMDTVIRIRVVCLGDEKLRLTYDYDF